MNVYTSPIDDEWHQPLPPPKVDAVKLSAAVIEGLQEGLEEVYVGDVAEDLIDRWAPGAPKLLELEMTRQGGRLIMAAPESHDQTVLSGLVQPWPTATFRRST
ncbi:MAG: hypothetical protein Ct9H300mP16_07380 [Pseudomonadota bacterium]|nr:MAG: hypothetical protein Ct9H300mP16_07380 [Pseudomonadota bacterium]